MKRVNVSSGLMKMILAAVEGQPSVRHVNVGPRHDPHDGVRARLDVRSALGRFLTKKGYVGKEMCAPVGMSYVIVASDIRKRGQREPTIEVTAVAV